MSRPRPEFGQPPDWMRSDTLAWLHRQRGRLRVATRNALLLYEVVRTEDRLGQLSEARAPAERALARLRGAAKQP